MPKTEVVCMSYKPNPYKLLNMKYHLFISKKATHELSLLIKYENWNNNLGRLYNYLDYIWRLQLIDKMVKLFEYNNNDSILVFHTGLYSKYNKQPVYMVLFPNNQFCNSYQRRNLAQEWRVAPTRENIRNESFVYYNELIRKYKIKKCDIPYKTIFDSKLEKCVFKKKYTFKWDLNKMAEARCVISMYMNTICNGYSNNEINERILLDALRNGVENTINKIRDNPKLIAYQVCINKQSTGYGLELLLPLDILINDKIRSFCIICKINHRTKSYEMTNVVSREIGYTNARTVGPIQVPWLKSLDYKNNNTFKYKKPVLNADPIITDKNNKNNININELKNEFSIDYYDDALIYIQTVLPLTLPPLK